MEAAALTEVAGQDFSLMALFLKADIVVKTVMLMLVFASIWSWAVALDKWFGVGGANKKAKQFEDAFWSGQPLDDISDRVGTKASDAMARVFTAGAREWQDARRMKTADPIQAGAMIERARSQMGVAVSREATRMESGLGTLAIIGSASPFIGLFGTVWGIMNAFRSIAAARETNLAVVAPGIAEALFATALGLAAAIPAVIFYNKFSGDIGKFTERMETFTEEFIVRLSRRITERLED